MELKQEKILKLFEKIASYPQQQMCKHAIMLDIVDFIDEHTRQFDVTLIRAISNADDEKILKRIQELKNPHNPV